MKIFTSCFIVASLAFLMVCCDNNSDPGNTPGADSRDTHANHKANFKVGLTYADSINDGTIPQDTLKPSVHRVTMGDVGDCHVHIEYGSPGVRGRSIWGGLVAYDEVWVAGAHNATSVRFSKPVEINGKRIDAGTYAFFAIPGRETWTLILNTRYKQHLADEYNADEDVVRVTVKPFSNTMTQRLTYMVEANDANSGSMVMFWDSVGVRLPLKGLP